MVKILHILTGPPGAGKTTYAKNSYGDLPVYDTDLGNKSDWETSTEDCILMTSAPSSTQKDYWYNLAKVKGFSPILHCIWVPRMTSLQRMSNRSGLTKTARNDLTTSVERWYKNYSRHQSEWRHE